MRALRPCRSRAPARQLVDRRDWQVNEERSIDEVRALIEPGIAPVAQGIVVCLMLEAWLAEVSPKANVPAGQAGCPPFAHALEIAPEVPARSCANWRNSFGCHLCQQTSAAKAMKTRRQELNPVAKPLVRKACITSFQRGGSLAELSMSKFGKRSGGGRRIAQRQEVGTAAVVTTIKSSNSAFLVDLSSSGARLRGKDLPCSGQTVVVKINALRAFGLVVWSRDAQCGVSFDSPLPLFEVVKLKREVQRSACVQQNLHVQLAYEDWTSGFMR